MTIYKGNEEQLIFKLKRRRLLKNPPTLKTPSRIINHYVNYQKYATWVLIGS